MQMRYSIGKNVCGHILKGVGTSGLKEKKGRGMCKEGRKEEKGVRICITQQAYRWKNEEKKYQYEWDYRYTLGKIPLISH